MNYDQVDAAKGGETDADQGTSPNCSAQLKKNIVSWPVRNAAFTRVAQILRCPL
jgi:hypothetical protein